MLDPAALPPLPGLRPWLVPDDYAQFSGVLWRGPAAGDAARSAWIALSATDRAAIATESRSLRRASYLKWWDWYREKRRALRLP